VLISGEAGIGKTTFVEVLCREATEKGTRVLVGRCYEFSETPPYGPWVELFAYYRQIDDETVSALPLPAPFRTRDAVGEAASQEVLFHVVGTYRADELTNQSHLAQLLPIFVREANTVRLNVSPLSEEETRVFVDRRFPLAERDRRRLAAYLRERGEGAPFFMSELLHTLEETEVLHNDGGAWTLGDLHDSRVPPLVRQVIRDRLGRLGGEAQSLLMIGALIGQEVPLGLWETVTRADEDTPVAVIERAQEAHLVCEMVETTRFRFVHALTREALMEALPISQRRRWHRQIAELLEARPVPDPDAVAYHYG
jgi:predicted ATPase